MSAEATQASVVTATRVPNRSRMGFLPRHFNKHMMFVEAQVFNWMERLCATYTGGTWEFYDLSNGGAYLAQVSAQPVTIKVAGNGFSGEMSADAAGIVATLFALTALMCKTEEDWAINKYWALREYAETHPDRSKIFAAID